MQAIWNHEPDENVEHIEEHGLTVEDVEFVLENYDSEGGKPFFTTALRVRLHTGWRLHHRGLRRNRRRHGLPRHGLRSRRTLGVNDGEEEAHQTHITEVLR